MCQRTQPFRPGTLSWIRVSSPRWNTTRRRKGPGFPLPDGSDVGFPGKAWRRRRRRRIRGRHTNVAHCCRRSGVQPRPGPTGGGVWVVFRLSPADLLLSCRRRHHRRRLVCRVGGKGNKNSPNRTSTPATVNCVPDVPTSSNPSIRTRFVVCLSRFIQYCPGLSVWFLARPVGKWFFSEMN